MVRSVRRALLVGLLALGLLAGGTGCGGQTEGNSRPKRMSWAGFTKADVHGVLLAPVILPTFAVMGVANLGQYAR